MNPPRRDPLGKSILRYLSSKLYRLFLRILNAFIRPKLLTPEQFGLWGILTVLPEYSTYLHLGARSAMRYRIPFHEGKGEEDLNEEIRSTVFYSSLVLNLLVATVLVGLAVFLPASQGIRIGILTIAAIVMVRWYHDHYIGLLMSYQQFSIITTSNYLRATVSFAVGVVLIWRFNLYGVYATALVAHAVGVLYMRARFPLQTRARFRWTLFKSLVGQGLPIVLLGLVSTMVFTAGRVIVSIFLGTRQLGFYGIAMLAQSVLRNISDSAREVIEPRLMEGMSSESDEQLMEKYFFRPMLNLAYVLPFIVGAGYFLTPFLVPLVLPRYASAVQPTQIIVLGTYFASLMYLTRGVVVARNWQLHAAFCLAAVVPVGVIASVAFLKAGFGLTGVAAGSALSYVLALAAMLGFVRTKCRGSNPAWRRHMEGIGVAGLLMLAAVFLIDYGTSRLTPHPLARALLGVFLFQGVFLLAYAAARKRYPHLKTISIRRLL